MKQTELIMGMPITVEIIGRVNGSTFSSIFNYFKSIDRRFSTYKKSSEISKINNGLSGAKRSAELKEVLKLAEQTKLQTSGYFDIQRAGKIDPSGLVKGLAIHRAAKLLLEEGYQNFFVEAGGDIQMHGLDSHRKLWSVGIRNPFNIHEIIKVLKLTNKGVATSGSYIRGDHIYNPIEPMKKLTTVASLTVIGPNIYEADRFATAAYAMGQAGLRFIENLKGFEAYMVSNDKIASFTSGFARYTSV